MSNKVNTVVPISLATLQVPDLIVENDNGQMMIKNGPVLGTVCLAGRVLSVSARDGFNAVQIDDTSALYTLFDYKHSDINVGDYIKAHGAVKKAKSNAGMFFQAFVIRKMEKQEADQMSVFLIEAILAQINHKNGPKTEEFQPSSMNQQKDTKMNQNANQTIQLPQVDGITSEHNQVLAVVVKSEVEEGAKVPDDFQHLKIPMQKIKALLQNLADEGHIYSTIDDNHFKTT